MYVFAHFPFKDLDKALRIEPNNSPAYAPTRLTVLDALEKRVASPLGQRMQPEVPNSPEKRNKKTKKSHTEAKELHPQQIKEQRDCMA